MGGRGAFYGKTNILTRHGYKAILRIGNMRVIEPVDKGQSRNTPTMSVTARAVYATLTRDGKPKQITVYSKSREKLYDIDLDHDHSNGQYPEGHVQYYVNGQREKRYFHPTDQQLKLVERLTYGLEAAGYYG